MPNCNVCGATGLTWHENLKCLVNEVTGRKHGPGKCLLKVRIYEDTDYQGRRIPSSRLREDEIAKRLVKAEMEAGLDPYKDHHWQRDGDYLILRP